jgi:hypothetical protein
MTGTVAIHQPNFFPWLGYFEKICRADIFILLDDVQYQKTGGAWSNRVKVLVNGEGRWITAPIERAFHGTRTLRQINFMANENWRVKVLKTLQTAYGRAPHYKETLNLLEPLILHQAENLAEFNIHGIISLAGALGLVTTNFVRSSSIPTEGVATRRLIELTQHVEGTQYMCGGGAGGYQEDAKFINAGIELVYQNFVSPEYKQHGSNEFVTGLSIIDALMNLGVEGVAHLLRERACV